jgi:hypothetical protein
MVMLVDRRVSGRLQVASSASEPLSLGMNPASVADQPSAFRPVSTPLSSPLLLHAVTGFRACYDVSNSDDSLWIRPIHRESLQQPACLLPAHLEIQTLSLKPLRP